MRKYIKYYKRIKKLQSLGWYKNMAGGFTESHCMYVISKRELLKMSDKDFLKMIS